ncbi:TIM protein, partial [Polyodon spathula]|nr:TIM protein [Polyodon spathula]
MENKHFQRLLKKLGIRAPASEQESFWRIPATLTPAQLRDSASSLCLSEGAPPGGSEEEEEEEEEAPPGGSEEEGEQGAEQRAGALRALLLARKRKRAHPDTAGNNPRSSAESGG